MNANVLLNHDYTPDDLVLTLNGEVVNSHFYNNTVGVIVDYTAPAEAGYYEYKVMSKTGEYVTPMNCYCVDVPNKISVLEFSSYATATFDVDDWRKAVQYPELNDLHGFTNIEVVCPFNVSGTEYDIIQTMSSIDSEEITDYGKLISRMGLSINSGDIVNFVESLQSAGSVKWDIQVTKEDGVVASLYQGTITVVG